MINIIYGPKGAGKTKQMIDAANNATATAKGHVIFITDTKRYMYDLKREVRFIDCKDFAITGEQMLCAFIKGIVAGNYDNETIFIDGAARISGKPLEELAALFTLLEQEAETMRLNITLSCSSEKENLPAFIAKYL